MKAILYNIFGLGHILPTLTLVRELSRQGVEVIYHSSPERRSLVEEAGARFINYGRDDYRASDYNPGKNFVQQTLPATLGLLPFLREEFERERPDFILYDSMAPWGLLLARLYDVPAFCLVTTFALGDSQKREMFRINRVEEDDASREAIRRLRDEYGVSLSFLDTLGAYHGCNLVFSPQALHGQWDGLERGRFHFVQQERTSPQQEDFPLAALVQDERTIVALALGTVVPQEDPSVLKTYRHFLQAFAEDPDILMILSTGTPELLAALGPLPGNVVARARIPQTEVMRHAQIFIHHGGMNSVREALELQVPQLVIPHQGDQHLNAQRVVEAGVGLRLARQEVSPGALKRRTLELVFSPSIRARLAELQANAGTTLCTKTAWALMRSQLGVARALG